MATDWLAADPLDVDILRRLLATRTLGRGVLEVHRSLGSTNERMRELARAGVGPGAVVLAEEQTRGRGRGGRDWISLAGAGLWMTVLAARGVEPPGQMTLGAGVAVRRAVRALGVRAELKWPNDLEIGGAKLCGILGEAIGDSTIGLGIGVNVHEAPPAAAIGRTAVALDQAAGGPVARNRLAALLLGELEQVLDDLDRGRQAQVLAAWREGCSHLGREVQVTAGAKDETGVATDIDSAGALLVRRVDGTVVRVYSGSLAVLAP
jgi:BirA family biotin operon repressor/biotin-[acetyl-CoA-carboxylase] ligase